MPLQALQNDNPLSIVWLSREVGPARLTGCDGVLLSAPFPRVPVHVEVKDLGLGALLEA